MTAKLVQRLNVQFHGRLMADLCTRRLDWQTQFRLPYCFERLELACWQCTEKTFDRIVKKNTYIFVPQFWSRSNNSIWIDVAMFWNDFAGCQIASRAHKSIGFLVDVALCSSLWLAIHNATTKSTVQWRFVQNQCIFNIISGEWHDSNNCIMASRKFVISTKFNRLKTSWS